MKTITPNSVYVLAIPDEAEAKSKSGLVLGEQSRETPKTAVIESIGSSVNGFKRGERIIYKDYTTTEIKLDGNEYVVLEQADILGKIIEVEG